jgi:excisionase family DNA binding protein
MPYDEPDGRQKGMPVSIPNTPLCYSPLQAAKLLNIGRTTLFALLARGEIQARKLGTRTLIPATELSRYIDSLPVAEFRAHDASGVRHG